MARVRAELQIQRLSQLGEGVASLDGRTVFVTGAAPGDRVLAEVDTSGKVFRGEVVSVLEQGPGRVQPFCALADQCGGCDWAHLELSSQLAAKQEVVLSTLEHLGRIDRASIEVRPPLRASATLGYRRRASLHVHGPQLGFFGRRSHEHVSVDRCPALVDRLADLPLELKTALGPLKEFSEIQLLAEGPARAVALHLRGPVKDKHRELARALLRKELKGLVLVPLEGRPELVGDPVLRSTAPGAPGVPLFLRPDAFAQAHGEGNALLVESALGLLAATAQERILELYCGNGNFTFGLAARAHEVVAVESSGVSIELGRRSAREARLTNVRFVDGDARKVTEGLGKEGQRFDAVLADPPRMGAKGLGSWAKTVGAGRVVYVACDPASLARDAAELAAHGFTPRVLQVIDMFPQTRHVEAVMSFAR